MKVVLSTVERDGSHRTASRSRDATRPAAGSNGRRLCVVRPVTFTSGFAPKHILDASVSAQGEAQTVRFGAVAGCASGEVSAASAPRHGSLTGLSLLVLGMSQ
jgi:hypothetical protein